MKKQRRSMPTFEINVVPYVDVLLVLLLVFMVSASVFVQDIMVALPNVDGSASTGHQEGIVLVIDRSGKLTLNQGKKHINVHSKALQDYLSQHTNNDSVITVQADQKVPYEKVAKVLATVQKSGIRNVNLLAQNQ